ncbi:hypothetical protein EAG_02136 [Camponotus floridanus]|uniref:Uncharacterized protein n=1 Tax=Camponotus floridanus TaxID=104421 RepID=E2B1R8_CAMFO|nr:hypothetical protein EAG_02136 [Camponotus floridanus]
MAGVHQRSINNVKFYGCFVSSNQSGKAGQSEVPTSGRAAELWVSPPLRSRLLPPLSKQKNEVCSTTIKPFPPPTISTGKVVWPTTTIRRGLLGCFWVLVCLGRDDSCALGSRCATTKQLPPIPPPLPPPLHHHHHYYHHQITITIEYISRSSGKL